MEGELRGLGEHAEQHQAQRYREHRAALQDVAGGEHVAQLEAAHHLADQQDAGEQRQPSPAGDRQRHARALAGIRAVAPEADQEERRETGQLPEHQHQQQVLRQHHAEHRAHEQQQEGVEAPGRFLLGQVVAGIEDDQHADAEDQQGEQEAQPVEAQAEVEAQFRQPVVARQQTLAGERAALAPQQRQAGQRHQRGGRGAGAATQAFGQDRQEDAQEWQRNDQRQNHRSLLFHSGRCPLSAGGASPRQNGAYYPHLSEDRHGMNYFEITRTRRESDVLKR
ncbi:hypothetical protein D9M70_249940 [compost metagenome]